MSGLLLSGEFLQNRHQSRYCVLKFYPHLLTSSKLSCSKELWSSELKLVLTIVDFRTTSMLQILNSQMRSSSLPASSYVVSFIDCQYDSLVWLKKKKMMTEMLLNNDADIGLL